MPRWIMQFAWTLFVVLVLALLLMPHVYAAPYPVCHWYWDLAVTSRAMAVEGIPVERTRGVIWRIFRSPNSQVISNGNRIIDLVYSPVGQKEEFVSTLGRVCEENDGRLEGVLGVES